MDTQKKKLIILGCLIIVFVILAICVWPKPKEEKMKDELEKRTIANTYTMYVRINPLVKLVYKETYEMCKKENGFEYACSSRESVVNNFELLNDDAREFYQELDFKGKDLLSVLVDICDIARDNKVGFSSFEIISDNLELDTADLKEKLKDNSRYETEYEIYVQFEEYLNEQEIIENNITKYKVIFETGLNNGTDQTILVKEKESVNEPISLLRDGYTFVEWQNNGKKFDFATPITKDTVLKAVWKKDKTTTTTKTSVNTKDKTTVKKTDETTEKTTTSKPTTTKKVSSVTSTMEKINLNDNILVSENHMYFSCTRAYYVFASNTQDVLDYIKTDNNSYSSYYELSSALTGKECSEYYKEEYDEELNNKYNNCMFESCSNIKESFNSKLKTLIWDTKAEDVAKQALEEIKTTKQKGITDFKYNSDHYFNYTYYYLILENANSLENFGFEYNSYYNNFVDKINNIFKNASLINEFCYGGCGGGGGDPVLLNEELCHKYNLTCDRW